MKKLHLLTLPVLGLMTSALLAGCGGDGYTHVVFWHTMGQSNQESLQKMIDTFTAANPTIKIDQYSQGGYADLSSKIKSAIPAGTTPTMAFCYPDNVADYLASGAMENMDSYINSETIGFTVEEGSHMAEDGKTVLYGVDDFVAGYWDEGTAYEKEGTYSVPFSKSTEALYYNKDYFEEHNLTVPTTWAEMWELCAQVRNLMGTAENTFPMGYDSDSNLFITLCEQLDIPYTQQKVSEAGEHYKFDNDAAKSMVSTLKGYYDDKLFITKGSQPNNTYTSTLFTEGKIVMSIGSTGGTTYNDSKNFKVGVAPVPVTDVEEPAIISQGPSVCFFSRASRAEKEAAWMFYKWITKTDYSAAYSMLTGYEPVRISSYESDNYKDYLTTGDTNIYARVANVTKDLTSWYFYSPVFSGSATARDAVGGIITNVLLGTKSITAAFDDAITECIFGS